MESGKRKDRSRDGESREKSEGGGGAMQIAETTEEEMRELDEPIAGPSRIQSGGKKKNTHSEKTQPLEERDTSLKTASLLEESMIEEQMVTPGEYVSLSSESETSKLEYKIKSKRNVRNVSRTNISTSKKARKRLYGDSEDEELEGIGVDTSLLLKLNEMTANDVAAKAYSYVRTIEDIRIKSGRLQGALSGRIKKALEAINDTITCLTRKATEKGDIEYVRKQNIELTRENTKLVGKNQSMQQENEIYKKRETQNGRIINGKDKETQPERIDEMQTIGDIGGRKRRRMDGQEAEGVRWALYSSEVEPMTSEGEQRYTETEDDTCSDLIREYRRTARISHKRTETALHSVKNTMREIDGTAEGNKTKEECTEGTGIQTVLREIKTIIEKHINKEEENIKSKKKEKPIIKRVENVQMKIPFLENRPKRDVTWADVVARRKLPEKHARRGGKHGGEDSEAYTTDEQELQEGEERMRRRERQPKLIKPEEIIERKKKKTAAISITTRGEITNKEIMMRARREIVLKDYDIEDCQIRNGFTGGLVIEIPGEDAENKADRLAIRLRDIFKGEQIRVNRPRIKVDIKITGLDESTTNDEIQETLSSLENAYQ